MLDVTDDVTFCSIRLSRQQDVPLHDDDGHNHHHLALQPFVGFGLLSQVSPSSSVLSCFLPVFFISSFSKSFMTSSCYRCLGLPTGLVHTGFQSNSFLVGLAWSILCIWPRHLILCALVQ